MNLIRTMLSLGASGLVLACTATVTVQLAGASVGWTHGLFGKIKLVRYAGVLYGLDPIDMVPGVNADEQPTGEEEKRETALAQRVSQSPSVVERLSALKKGTDDIRSAVLGLKFKRERHDLSRKAFESYLQQLENDNRGSSLREIYITLDAVPPKQAKDIIYAMLTGTPDDPDVMECVVAVLRMMSVEKISKTFGEFKTSEEKALLHDILVRIGKLDDRRTQLTGGQP